MVDVITHTNHVGEVLKFNELGIYINSNDLHDFSYNITSQNNKIKKITKGITLKTIPFLFFIKDRKHVEDVKNKFFEHFEKDVVANEKGYFQLGDYKLYGFVTSSKKTNYLIKDFYMQVNMTFTTDQPNWIKDVNYSFRKENVINEETEETKKQYDYTYDYTYGNYNNNSYYLNVNNLRESDFKIIVYGVVSSPEINIDNHIYSVNVDVEKGEYLIIDSRYKTITKVTNKGEHVNCFNLRNKDYSPFKKIKSGSSHISWSGLFNFDLTIYEERSEPEWI